VKRITTAADSPLGATQLHARNHPELPVGARTTVPERGWIQGISASPESIGQCVRVSATTFMFSVFVLWVVIGIVSAFVMGRRGHDPYTWLLDEQIGRLTLATVVNYDAGEANSDVHRSAAADLARVVSYVGPRVTVEVDTVIFVARPDVVLASYLRRARQKGSSTLSPLAAAGAARRSWSWEASPDGCPNMHQSPCSSRTDRRS
jgi:hypothetical protein